MDYTQFPNISIPPVEGEYLYHDGRKEKNYDNYITTVISSEGTIIDNCYGQFSSSVEIIKQPFITFKGKITKMEELLPSFMDISIPPIVGEYGYYDNRIKDKHFVALTSDDREVGVSFSSKTNHHFEKFKTNHGIITRLIER